MKVLTAGYKYRLESFEGGSPQEIQFIEKVPIAQGEPELRTVNDGTTNEEVLAMLIDRAKHLPEKDVWILKLSSGVTFAMKVEEFLKIAERILP